MTGEYTRQVFTFSNVGEINHLELFPDCKDNILCITASGSLDALQELCEDMAKLIKRSKK